jgi:hypothetical protein
VADLRCDELDREGGDPVADAAGDRERERLHVRLLGAEEQAASDDDDQEDHQLRQRAEAGVVIPGRRPPDREESGHTDRGGPDPAEHDGIRARTSRALNVGPFAQVPADQDGPHEVADQEWLYQREAPEAERRHLQGEAHDVGEDGGQPQRLPDQIGEDPGRQRLARLDLLRAPLVGDRRDPEEQRAHDGCHHGDQRGGHQLAAAVVPVAR